MKWYMVLFLICIVLANVKLENVTQSTVIESTTPLVADEDDIDTSHQVAIFVHGQFFCSGSLIGPRTVLTGGHCAFNYLNYSQTNSEFNKTDYVIRYGTAKKIENATGLELGVEKVILHPGFNMSAFNGGSNYSDDIALLCLEQNFEVSANAKVVGLAKTRPPTDATGILTGWTPVKKGNPLKPKFLRFARRQKILSRQQCEKSNFIVDQAVTISDSMICAEMTNDVCWGNSGSALMYNGQQVGVFSFLDASCKSGPAVYSDVVAYETWIAENLCPSKPNIVPSSASTATVSFVLLFAVLVSTLAY